VDDQIVEARVAVLEAAEADCPNPATVDAQRLRDTGCRVHLSE
jgi:hypothetical protein